MNSQQDTMHDNPDELIDYISGHKLFNSGAELNRQAVERFLVDCKGFLKTDILVDVPISFNIGEKAYHSRIDLAVSLAGKRFLLIKCAAGSLGSREREIIAAARLLEEYQIPMAAVSDGKTAILLDTISGRQIETGLDKLPSKAEALKKMKTFSFLPLPEKRREKEKLIFRTYDSMNVNTRHYKEGKNRMPSF